MLKLRARNVRLRKIDTTDRACAAVAAFLATTDKEQVLLRQFLEAICATWNRCLTSAQVGQFRRKLGVAESTMHVLLTQLDENEVIRKVPAADSDRAYLYFLHENFGKALFRVVRAYRRQMLPPRKPRVRTHPAFLK